MAVYAHLFDRSDETAAKAIDSVGCQLGANSPIVHGNSFGPPL